MKLLLVMSLLCFNTYAQDNLAAHSHDEIEVDVVVDKEENKLIIALEGAAMPILGFEGEANSKEKKETLSKVKELWGSAKEWLSIASLAGCKVASSSFNNEIEEDDDHHHEKDHHNAHSEVEAELIVQCEDISKIKMTKFSFFKVLEDKKILSSKAHIELSVIPANSSAYKKEIEEKAFDIKL